MNTQQATENVIQPTVPLRKHYFTNELVEWQLTQYIWTGCTKVHLRDQIMSHATELIRQIIRKQGLHTIYPGQEESAFGDLLQTGWCQIERVLYKYRACPHCRICFNPDRPSSSLLYEPEQREYGIKTLEEIIKIHGSCPHCGAKLTASPIIEPAQGRYGGSNTILYRGISKVFNMWCVSPNTMIPTCHGPLSASEVGEHFEAGLPVHIDGLDGLSLVEAVKYRDYSDILRITTVGGYELECSKEHRLYTHNSEGIGWFEAQNVSVGDLVAIRCGQNLFGDHSSLSDISLLKRGKWINPQEITEELAYIFGLYIAEGSYSYGKLVIYTIDREIIDKLINNSLGLNFIHEPQYQRVSLCNARFIEMMKQLGFEEHTTAQSKSIPVRLLCLPRKLITKLLSGIFDGDGHSVQSNGTIEFTSTSNRLLSQLRMILLNFGIMSKISHDNRDSRDFIRYDSKLSGSTQLLLSALDSKMFYDLIGFGLSRKQNNLSNLRYYRNFVFGLNDRFRSLYNKYGSGNSNYNKLRKLLKADKCTVETAQEALNVWCDHDNDEDYLFIKNRLDSHVACQDRLVWVPIKEISCGKSELIDFAVNAKNHSYIANGMVVHNSQISRTVILAYIKKEARDRKNSSSYVCHLTNKPKPTSDTIIRFLNEAKDMCKFHDDYLSIIMALEYLINHDDRPYDGIVGKLVELSGMPRQTVTGFMKFVRLRSFEFTDSPVSKNVEPKLDTRRSSTIEDEEG